MLHIFKEVGYNFLSNTMSKPWDKRWQGHSLQLLQAVLQNAGVGLMVQDRTRRIVLLNPAFEEITGWRWQEIGGKECPEVFGCHTSSGKCLMDNHCPGLMVIGGGGTTTTNPPEAESQEVSRELLINRGDGGKRWVEVTVSPIKGKGGEVEYIVSTFKDISEKKRYSEELLHTRTLATLGQLAAELAHEIKNPLNSIHIQMCLIEKELARWQETLRVQSTSGGKGSKAQSASGGEVPGIAELVSRAREEIKRLNELVNQCLSFSRSAQLYLKHDDLKPLLEDLVGLIKPQANLGGIDVELAVEASLPGVMMDREKFKQALLNLLLNALEAMPDGGHLYLRAWRESDFVKLSIRDTGMGIPDEIKERVFELFYTTKGGGTGIGLPLAHNIVQAHGGTISFNSSPKGTEFVITLPVATNIRRGDPAGRPHKTRSRQGER